MRKILQHFMLSYLHERFQSSASGPSASGSQSFEPDILEEDLDDAPYTPYAYAKKAKNKKGMKK